MIKDSDYLIKLILIGTSGVGKTSILSQFADNKFSDNFMTTIGVDFKFKTIMINDKKVKFQIWDTAGQERFRTITSTYYKGADGIIMVYDLTDPTTLEDIEQFWIPEAFNYCDRGVDVILLGNKSDCPNKIVDSKLQALLEKHPTFVHEKVSAKNNEKVCETIRDLGIKVMKKKDSQNAPSTVEFASRPQPIKQPHTPKIDISSKREYDLKYDKKCC